MYTWGDSLDGWTRPGVYRFDKARAAARKAYAKTSKARGGRTYEKKRQPNRKIASPKKRIASESANPLIVGIDVTGSMSRWPAEIFDRLPLLYQTLSQYRPDLEIAFAAIGDARCDRWPLQVTDFAKGVELDDNVKALYGEGGGGDRAESYQLFAHYVATRADVPAASEDAKEKPFLLVFGDADFHPTLLPSEVKRVLGDQLADPVDSVAIWKEVARHWNVYLLRRPDGGRPGDVIHQQWAAAIGDQKIVYVDDELRCMDYAMGIVARTWGHFTDFEDNMRARQDDKKVRAVSEVANSLLGGGGGAAAAKPSATRKSRKRARKAHKARKSGKRSKPAKNATTKKRAPGVPKTRKSR